MTPVLRRRRPLVTCASAVCLLAAAGLASGCPVLGAFESGPCGNRVEYPTVVVTDAATGAPLCDATVVAVPAYADGGSYYAIYSPDGGEWLASPDAGTADYDAATAQDEATELLLVSDNFNCSYTGADLMERPSSYVLLVSSPHHRPTFATASETVTSLPGCAPSDEWFPSPPIQVALTKM